MAIATRRSTAKQSLGRHGEQIAENLLESKGFTIVSKNWRSGKLGEIDLIALDPRHDLMVFVEVKTRRSDTFESALEAVTPDKQQRLVALAERYLQSVREDTEPRHDLPRHIRFDVIAVMFNPRAAGLADVRHLENAFDL